MLKILTNGFTQALPTSNVTPTTTPRSDCHPRVTSPMIFSRLSTSVLTILTKDFTQALPTSNVTPTTTPCSDSPPRGTYPKIFPVSLPPFLHFHEAVEPYLQRHPYVNEIPEQVLPCCGMAGHIHS